MAELIPTDQQALITEVLGPRCDQFHAQCMTCLAWKMLDEIERLTAINRLRFSDGQWQPIETKPPGRRVLLWFPQLGYPVTGDSEVYSYVSGGWKATHWMPAPAGPTELAPGGIPEPNCSSSPESGTGSASSGDVGDGK